MIYRINAKKFSLIGVLVLFFFCQNLFATHNRAGEITYRQLDDLTIEATITTYTKATSVEADRDSLTICWGDGMCEVLLRSNGTGNPPQGELLENDSKINFYIGRHEYPALGHYQISMLDPNRNGGIINIRNSINIPFFLQTSVTLFNSQFQGLNNSPILLQPPIDVGCVGQPFVHTPNAYEVDGDSLVFELIVPQSDINTKVPNYAFPSEIRPGPDNDFDFDTTTGTIRWDSPQAAGEYNVAMMIIEFRDGQPIDSLIRDMQILISNCENEPPVVDVIDEICVVAGDTVRVSVTVDDPDEGQRVQLTATGGPFELPNQAVLNAPSGFVDPLLEGEFEWVTTCADVQDQPYTVVFRGLDDSTGLADLKTLKIKVVAPPPEVKQLETTENGLLLTWVKPYTCEEEEGFFRGFSVWRKAGSNMFDIDTCETGLSGRGYERIIRNTLETAGDSVYFFEDEGLEKGQTYCYRILGHFAGESAGGFEFNRIASISSAEICFVTGRDLPAFTNIDVLETDENSGSMRIAWLLPDDTVLDTNEFPGPYEIQLSSRTASSNTFTEIASFTSNTLAGLDTMFMHENINTSTNQYYYTLTFLSNGEEVGESPEASSIFLTATPTNERIDLTWNETVPWINDQYTIFRENDLGVFDSIGTTSSPTFQDTDVRNGETYCYKVSSIGSYPSEDIEGTYINNSQETCAIPVDNVPPCPPIMTITNNCDIVDLDLGMLIQNQVSATPVLNESCEEPLSYRLYFSEDSSSFVQIDESSSGTFSHMPPNGLLGCYYVTTVDSLSNESEPSNVICKDNCPEYRLPNTFTPNGDNQNDFFIPRVNRFIESVEMKIYNVDGALVFESVNPDLNWDGTNLSGSDLPDGTYYYICTFFEQRLSGTVPNPNPLSGYIMLIRGN